MTTPRLPASRPYISAMIEPTCSWRTRIVWISRESWSASKMRPVSPPGMPKTNWMPASSRTRTSAWGTSISSGIMVGLPSPPELFGSQPRALGHRLELGPGDLGLDLVDRSREGREPAVGARHHALAPDDLRVAHEPLGDQLGMLDEVGRRVEHAGNDEPVVRQLHVLEHDPLVLVTRVGALEGQGLRPRLERDREDLLEGDVAVVRRSEEHTSELQSRQYLVCRLLLEKKKKQKDKRI